MLIEVLPAATVAVIGVVTVMLTTRLMRRRVAAHGGEGRFRRQIVGLVLAAVFVVLFVLVLPVGEGTRNQLLALFGLVLTAIIGLSSTTFVSNAMASIMLHSVNSFRPGDFIRVGEHFGRVTERGLFHTELQTEDRDLTTLPNIFLVQNPVTVVHSSGTIVSALVSLGYDNAPETVEPLLVLAAADAELTDPFVQIVELGNFAINYRVAGFLAEVKQILSVRSQLRHQIIHRLHGAGIEIMSPTYMGQRPLEPGTRMVPAAGAAAPPVAEPAVQAPEAIAFDKAERAAQAEAVHKQHASLLAEIEGLEKQLAAAPDEERGGIEKRLDELRAQVDSLAQEIEKIEAPRDNAGEAET